jgi:uncharacterized protein YoxC
MDSNFQVRISADISALEKSIKEAQSTLNSLKSTTDSTTSSFNTMAQTTNKVGADMNRARLATFAFGQVIRDAGFFSQSFGLGVLAISNNIPILIDQLVLLSGVSAGVGAALSLIGSALAAGLTVFAYWSQGVERNGGTVSGAINKMANDSEGAIGRLVDYLSKPPASNMLSAAVSGLEEAVGMINQIMRAAVDFAIAVWSEFGSDISTVFKTFYGIIYNTMNTVLNIFRFASSVIKGDFTGAFEAIGNIAKNVINNIIGLIQIFVKASSTLLGTLVSTFDPLKGAIIKNAGQQLVQFGDSIKFASEQASESTFSFKDFLNTVFKGKEGVDQTKKSVDALKQSYLDYTRTLGQLNKAQSAGVTGTVGELTTPSLLISDDDLAREQQRIENINKQSRAIEALSLSTQNANQWVQHLAQTVGGELVNSFNAMLTTGTFSFEGISKAILDMIKRLAAAAIAAGVLSSILSSLFPGAGNTGFKDIFGMITGMRLGGGVTATSAPSVGSMATNGINTSINTVNSSSGGGVLETRVSGNDLVILFDRASNNRNKYF